MALLLSAVASRRRPEKGQRDENDHGVKQVKHNVLEDVRSPKDCIGTNKLHIICIHLRLYRSLQN